MSERSGLHADWDIVSVAWLPESGWEPRGPQIRFCPPIEQCYCAPPIFIPYHLQLPDCRAFPFSPSVRLFVLGLPGEPLPVSLEGACQVCKLSGHSEGPPAPGKVALGGQVHCSEPGKPWTWARLIGRDIIPPGHLLPAVLPMSTGQADLAAQ